MPRRPRRIRHRGSPSGRPPRPAVELDPAARLRALVEEGIVAAAAITACDDLERAAASTQRLGALSSGMWRALSRELATAADRLDRSTAERLDDITRRARSLDVDADEVIGAGLAAAHLDGHRETLEMLVPRLDDAHQLIQPNMLFGLSIGDPFVDDDDILVDEPDDEDILLGEPDEDILLGEPDEDKDEEEDEDVEESPLAIRMWLFFWPAPLTPATVSILPSLAADPTAPGGLSVSLSVDAPVALLEPLYQATGLSAERLEQALGALAVACWTAHQQDDEAEDEPDDLSDEEDQSLGVDDGPDA